MELQEFIRMWEKIPTEEALENARLYWNLRATEFNDQGRDNCVEIQDLLELRDYDTRGKRMLDIGCGTGKCAIRFSETFDEVVGVDLSDEMIHFARENANLAGRSNVHFHTAPWEYMDLEAMGWTGGFDVVVASMTPGISNVAELQKMCAASRDLCMLSSFVHRRDLKVEIEEHLGLKTAGDVAKNKIYLIFNILWHLGYHPEISYTHPRIFREYTLEEALTLYARQLNLDEQQQRKLANYLENRLEQGRIRQDYQGKIGWLCWQV